MVHCHRRHSSSTLSHLNRERERSYFDEINQIKDKGLYKVNKSQKSEFTTAVGGSGSLGIILLLQNRSKIALNQY